MADLIAWQFYLSGIFNCLAIYFPARFYCLHCLLPPLPFALSEILLSNIESNYNLLHVRKPPHFILFCLLYTACESTYSSPMREDCSPYSISTITYSQLPSSSTFSHLPSSTSQPHSLMLPNPKHSFSRYSMYCMNSCVLTRAGQLLYFLFQSAVCKSSSFPNLPVHQCLSAGLLLA